LHNEELPDIIGGDKIKEDEMARMEGAREMHMGLMWGNLKESDHLEEQSADGTMLKLFLKKTGWKWNWSGSR
jgi:hypothetical protein